MTQTAEKTKMEYVRVGKSGLKVSYTSAPFLYIRRVADEL